MRRSYLKKKYLKKAKSIARRIQKIKNHCSKLYEKERNFFNRLKVSFVTDNNLFWKTSKPFFLVWEIMEQILNLLKNKKFCKFSSLKILLPLYVFLKTLL